MTFSLLPQFMAAGMAGALQQVEDCAAAERARLLAVGKKRGIPGGLLRFFPIAAILLCQPCRGDSIVSGSRCRRFAMTARP